MPNRRPKLTRSPGCDGPSRELESLFRPHTIAVIGATAQPDTVGAALMKNLREFKGQVFPINPNHSDVFGIPCYHSVGDVPCQIDLAVVATPAETVPGIIRQCVESGVVGGVVISAGFKECGENGSELEHRLSSEARQGGMRIVGPNCLGIMLPHQGLNATFASAMAQPGRIAFLSQSGALCTGILDWSFRKNVGFSAIISLGSMSDVGWGDVIRYFGADPHTTSIVCYIEAVGDAQALLAAAQSVSTTKPIVVLKVGRSEAAARAAASHTGALSSRDAVLDAAFDRVGILRVDSLGELFDLTEALAKQPLPKGPRLAIITNAGGPGVLATDGLGAAQAQVARLGLDTMIALNKFLPAHWSHNNPVDVLGDASASRYANSAKTIIADEQVDGLLALLTPQSMTDVSATASLLSAAILHTDKTVLACWLGGPSVEAGRAILNAVKIPTLETPEAASNVFARLVQLGKNRSKPVEEMVASHSGSTPGKDRSLADHIIVSAETAGRTLLSEAESKDVLAAYGIPTVESRIALDEETAIRYSLELGFPVVVKLHSERLTHKSDVGGVHLDIRDPGGVSAAWRAIESSVLQHSGPGHFLGVTVQPMIPRGGVELILGSSTDPQFGPVILFGMGGHLVEILDDTVLGLPPLDSEQASKLMSRTRIFRALKGFRGEQTVDLGALNRLLVHFSRMILEQRRISEIDINPLYVSSGRLIALDARIVLHPAGLPQEALPLPALYFQEQPRLGDERSTLGQKSLATS